VERKKVVVIGGGTGTFTVLSGLKKYPVDLTAIVTMMDSGGSNRILRDEFGILPTSDIRQCMVALASDDSDELLRKLFNYRFNAGIGISGMTFGNLFMAALTDIYGSQEKAIKKTCEILCVAGKIVPVTFDNVNLVARYENGKQVLGEHQIDEPGEELGKYRIVELGVFPEATVNPEALKSIRETDMIVLGPGDFYTSILCNVVVDGVAAAIKKSKAKKVFVMNLMTKYGQSNGFAASDFVVELEKYLGRDVIDYYLVNKPVKFPKGILSRYREEKAVIVKDDLAKIERLKGMVIRKNFVSGKVFEKQPGDKLMRSLIRHDPGKLAGVIIDLL
jgi:uncharacterized cofD-like protein